MEADWMTRDCFTPIELEILIVSWWVWTLFSRPLFQHKHTSKHTKSEFCLGTVVNLASIQRQTLVKLIGCCCIKKKSFHFSFVQVKRSLAPRRGQRSLGYQGMQGFGQLRTYDSSVPVDTCISVVYVVNCRRKKDGSSEFLVAQMPCETLTARLTLLSTGLVDSTSYMVFTEIFWKQDSEKIKRLVHTCGWKRNGQRRRSRHSLPVWSGSCTSWPEFGGRPGRTARPSGRSWSPGRTSGPVSRRSWH